LIMPPLRFQLYTINPLLAPPLRLVLARLMLLRLSKRMNPYPALRKTSSFRRIACGIRGHMHRTKFWTLWLTQRRQHRILTPQWHPRRHLLEHSPISICNRRTITRTVPSNNSKITQKMHKQKPEIFSTHFFLCLICRFAEALSFIKLMEDNLQKQWAIFRLILGLFRMRLLVPPFSWA